MARLALALLLLAPLVASGCLATVQHAVAPKPPCEDGLEEHPRDGICVKPAEACRAWMSGAADQKVECAAESRDGEGYLQVNLQGTGSALVRVLDAKEDVVFEEPLAFSRVEHHVLDGRRGDWTLEVTFEETKGAANVVLWG